MQIYFWSFDKRKNSTAIPVVSGVEFTGELKEPFTITELTVSLNLGPITGAPTYNYAYIPSMRRYYFVMNWAYNGGLWYAALAVDALASFKTEIGNSYQYIARAYSDYDANLVDTAYITTPENISRANSSITPTDMFGGDVGMANGTIVMGVIGQNSGAVGAVTYYAMSFSTFAAFMGTMLGSITWAGISATEISTELQKALINPTQYIVSCMWFPVYFSSFTQGVPVSYVNLGWWSFSLQGTARLLTNISSAWVYKQQEMPIPKHPRSNSARMAFLQCAPYSTYYLKFLPFGVFPIDSTELYDKSQLGLLVDFNLMTGDAVLHVAAKNYDEVWNFENSFLVTEGKIGVTIPIGQVSADIGNYKQALTAGITTGIAQLIDGGGV